MSTYVNPSWMRDLRASMTKDTVESSVPLALGLLLFTPVMLLGNELGTFIRYPESGAAVLFVPYAILTTALVVSAERQWVWYIAVAAFAHFATHWPQWPYTWVLIADVANISRALISALLLRSVFPESLRLESVRGVTVFVLVAALMAPAVAATIGASNVLLHDVGQEYWPTWRSWFVSNALTGLTLLPALVLVVLNLPRWKRRPLSRQRTAEALAITIGLVASTSLALWLMKTREWPTGVLFYSPLPLLIWVALRFGIIGAAVATTAVTFAGIWSLEVLPGTFPGASPDENILVLQLFLFLTAIPIMFIAVVNSSRHGVVQLHRALLASLHDHIAILDGRGIVLEVNDAWREFARHTGLPSYKRVQPGDNYLSALQEGVQRGESGSARVLEVVTSVLRRERDHFEMEYDLDCPDRPGRYQLNIEALERADGGIILRRTDLTARRQAQIEVEEQRRVLSHLARVSVLGQLSGAMAHELNQPLTSIATNAEAAIILLKRDPPDLAEISAILDDIVSEDQRAAQVIRRLRALLRRGEMKLQSNDVRELVNEALELAHMELITRGVTATTSIAADMPPVLADRVQLQQVLLNLILNACEAMGSKPIAERRVELLVTSEARHAIQFSVRDSGTGIPMNLMDRLFEPFVTTKPEGLGLGLSVSRTIVAAHGGRMWAENNADGGATVHLLLEAGAANTVVRPARVRDIPLSTTASSGQVEAMPSPSA